MSVFRLSRRLGWLPLLALLCWPRVAIAAEPVQQQVYADFDGDGQRDHAAVDATQSSILRVWLSGTQRTGILRTHSPVVGVAAMDLDGDGRAALVVATARSTGIHVWKARGGRFKRYQPRPIATTLTPGSPHRSIKDDPAGASDSTQTRTYNDPAALDANAPALTAPRSVQARAPLHDQHALQHHSSDRSAPRAPPTPLV
jgi:hypothetical protein